ncbi:unnamed protein product [Rangifer tarandus platyrhynchus]|uniref:Uncharacterized protein n=1 Tax=Rangifer tarandus platyrhynchus TaxID=3082113 RepID=A0ABN8ZFZ3_RANTA|nr:unnamed protein product [Rangifer tarandus platyrhynchus]CAI9689115.1 unnamed protein product [Rangifer tarandus platyrhynchus]
MEGSSLAGSASPRGVASTCLPLPAGSGPSGGGLGPSPCARCEPRPARACALRGALSAMLLLCSSLPRGSSGQALGPGLPVCTLRSPAGKSREIYPLPNEPVGFSSATREAITPPQEECDVRPLRRERGAAQRYRAWTGEPFAAEEIHRPLVGSLGI